MDDQSKKPVTMSLGKLLTNVDVSVAAERARIMLGCYRKADAGDPEIYTSAIISVLMRYPESVVMQVTEPSTGLPSKLKWLPAVAEVREACDDYLEPMIRAWRRERVNYENSLLLASPKHAKPSREEITAVLEKHGLKKIDEAPVKHPADGHHMTRAMNDLALRNERRKNGGDLV